MRITSPVIQKLKHKAEQIVYSLIPVNLRKEIKEKIYYRRLFIENTEWNKPSANSEEVLRWTIIKKFIDSIPIYEKKTFSILDLGCGRAWLTNLLNSYGDTTGIEPVKAVLNYGKKMFPDLKLLAGDSKTLLNNGYAGKFDLVVCSEVIEHIPDEKKADFVKDIKHLMKAGGYAIITTPRKDAQDEWRKYSDPNQPVEDWLSEKELEELFINMGFEKMLLDRFSIPPRNDAPDIEIYQLWLFRHSV